MLTFSPFKKMVDWVFCPGRLKVLFPNSKLCCSIRILLQKGFAIVIQLFGPKMLLQQEKLMYQFLDFKEACKENVEQQVTEQ